MRQRALFRPLPVRIARAWLAVACAFALTLAALAPSAQAVPLAGRLEARRTTPAANLVRLGSDRASMTASSSAITAGEPFGYTGVLRISSPADSAFMRLKLWRPTGRLIFQRTTLFPGFEKAKTVQAAFERTTEDLGLKPGVYPVELEISVTRKGHTETGVLQTRLFVLNQRKVIPTALVIHVNGQPLADPNGVFVMNPAEYTRARDDVNTITEWVLAGRGHRCTMAISPLLLEEWQRIADGYKLVSPDGTVEVAAGDEVPLAYSTTLTQLTQAIETGRLELTSQGYSDPDLADLEGAGMIGDVDQQYEHAVSAVFASLEATASTGTVPAGGWLPPDAVPLLKSAGVRYAVVNTGCARSGIKAAFPSAYRSSSSGIVVLVADDTLSAALKSGDSSATTSLSFQRVLDESATGPLVISAEVGAGGASAKPLLASFAQVTSLPWITTRLAREVAAAPKERLVRLRAGLGTKGDPATYWDEVREGRVWSDALIAAVGDSSPEAVTAHRDSMIAQCSAWAGFDGAWALEHRGRTFASTAKRLSTDVLGKVSLAVQPVTLAGTGGNIPVTISNGSGQPLVIRMQLSSDNGISLSGQTKRTLHLGPKDTFIEVPVQLANVLSGDVHVALSAGDTKIDSATVKVSASYLDRVALIVGVIIALVVLLVFIIRRVNSAEQGWTAEGDDQNVSGDSEAYTGQTSFDSLWKDKR